jgi:signal peptidase I
MLNFIMSAKFNKAQKNNIFDCIKSKLKFLDPFFYVDTFVMPKIKNITDSKIVEGLVNLVFAGLFAIIFYLLLGFLFGTASPLVIVYSASMEPEFYRGDVMALSSYNENVYLGEIVELNRNIKEVPVEKFATPFYENGQLTKIIFENGQEVNYKKDASIIVYPSYPINIPIIHRAITKINANDGIFVLTKGDNDFTNNTYDQDCGKIDSLRKTVEKNCITFYAVPIEQIQGVSFARIPLVGCVKLWLFDDLLSLIVNGKLPKDFKGIC